MEIIASSDVKAFQQLVLPFLLTHEARNCVALGVLSRLVTEPDAWKKFYLNTLKNYDKVVGVMLMTPPFPLNLIDVPLEAMPQVVAWMRSQEARPSGVLGSPQIVDAFAELWCEKSGVKIRSTMRQGIFQLERVNPIASVTGSMVRAEQGDFDLLLDWNRAFCHDCKLPLEPDLEEQRKRVEQVLKQRSRFLWSVDGQPVAMAGAFGKTPNGIRLSWVYTPQAFRGKGYATALVASLSQAQLDAGNRFCFLYTDLTNPTSNAIYQKIGYLRLGDSSHIVFDYDGAGL